MDDVRLRGVGPTAAVIAAAVGLSLTGVAGSLWAAVQDHQSVASTALVASFMVAFAATGAVVAAARPGNGVGWLMLAGAAVSSLGNAGASLAHHGIVVDPGSLPGASAFAVAGQSCRSLGWYLLTLGVPAVFPDGRFLASRRRWLPILLGVVLVASVVGPITDKQADLTGLGSWQNPIAPTGGWQFFQALAFILQAPLGLVVAVAIVGQLVRRWRQGGPLLRQQLQLFIGAAAIGILAVPVVFALGTAHGDWVFGAAAVPLPIAIGFAVLARDLYDLRTAANRTLVWVTLSALIVGLYALVIQGLGSRLDVHGAAWLAWVAAGVVAVAFAPLRDVLQRGINRLTFGRWDEPYDVLAALGQRLEASVDVDRLLADVVSELHGLGLGAVAVYDADGRVVAGDVATTDHLVAQPLAAFGRPVGTLRYQRPGQPLRQRDRRLLEDLAGHLGGVLHARHLTADLQRALERQVLAREEERRRLRRDLHDGLGPALAGHLLRLDLIASKVAHDPAAYAEVDRLRQELRGTVLEVRRVVEGLRPPALDELGLAGALSQVLQRLSAGSAVRVGLHVEELPPLSAAIEVAAFRIVTEAVTNVVRHAGAAQCTVCLVGVDGMLRVTVTDDGCGMAVASPAGNGLHTMRERAEELRGRLRIEAGSGTTVVAELPLPPAARTPSAPVLAAER